MLVKEVMSRKVRSLSPNETFSQIVKFLVKHRISGAPVVNKKGKVVGIVSEKDLLYKLFPSEKTFYKDPEYYMDYNRIESDAAKVRKLTAKHFMTKEVISVASDDHILKACSVFIFNKIRRLPVMDDGKLVGIVTTNDIYKKFLTVILESADNKRLG